MMRRVLILILLAVPMMLASCQCANKPDIGPVEDEARLEASPQQNRA